MAPIPNETPVGRYPTPQGTPVPPETPSRWTSNQRFTFWAKLGVLIAPTVLILTFFLTTCGGVKAIGGQTAERAEEQHLQMKAEFEAQMKTLEDRLTRQRIESESRYNDGMTEVRKALDSISYRIDRVLERDRPGRKP